MSCDGNEPGCPVCHPDMVEEARADLRALQRAQLSLCGTAAKDGRFDAEVLRVAAVYREAAKRANRWNAFGTALKSEVSR
jgi:hypothetical protein